jgi:hypothetical protein
MESVILLICRSVVQQVMVVQDYDQNQPPGVHTGMQLMHACAENMLFLDSTTQALFADQKSRSKAPKTIVSEEDKVQLMTIHKSKGLEFSVVFVLGLSEAGVVMRPSFLPTEDEFSKEEAAKNVVYVGVTRAKDALVVSSHFDITQHAPHGMRAERFHGAPSRFLAAMYKECDVEVYTEEDFTTGGLPFRGSIRQLGYPKNEVCTRASDCHVHHLLE